MSTDEKQVEQFHCNVPAGATEVESKYDYHQFKYCLNALSGAKKLIMEMDDEGRMYIQYHIKVDEKGPSPQDVFVDFYVSMPKREERGKKGLVIYKFSKPKVLPFLARLARPDRGYSSSYA